MAKLNKKATVVRAIHEDEVLPFNLECFTEESPPEPVVDLKNTVFQDTREQKGWYFNKEDFVLGTERRTLKTGDYTLAGYENQFVVERKGSTSEFSQNIFEKRFEAEMQRLEEFKYPFLICEFTMDDLIGFPVNSGIPPKLWYKVKINGKFLVSSFLRYQTLYKTKFILAGEHGQEICKSIFKQVLINATPDGV